MMERKKEKIIELMENIIHNAREKLHPGNNKNNELNVEYILMLLLEKIIKRTRSICILLEDEKIEDGAVLSRALLEQVIQFKLCCEDDKNIRKFIDQAETNVCVWFKSLNTYNLLDKETVDQFDEVGLKYKEKISNISELAKVADLYELYLLFYKELSWYVHNSFLILPKRLCTSEHLSEDKDFFYTALIETLEVVQTCLKNK